MILIGLIDVIFLLLIFFLVTKVVTELGKMEQKVLVGVPKNEPGYAQILIQVVDPDSYIWLDYKAFEPIYKSIRRPDQLSPQTRTKKFREGLSQLKPISFEEIKAKITNKLDSINKENERAVGKSSRNPQIAKYYFLIRCPDRYPYGVVVDLLRLVEENRGNMGAINYGTTGGDFDDIAEARSIEYVEHPAEVRVRF